MDIGLGSIRTCFDGVIPSVIATCALDGTPNIANLSQVHYVDTYHVALSFQFFNTTRKNILANPHAMVQVVEPETATHYRLRIEYLRTETEGPLFESMKAKLASIASHSGMRKVFRLQGSDIYRVHAVERVPGPDTPCSPRPDLLSVVREFSRRLTAEPDLSDLLERALSDLGQLFDIHHAMVLVYDAAGRRLYTVASRGYPESGVGSEIALGEGIIGVAAEQRLPIRFMHAASEYRYSHAARLNLAKVDPEFDLETEIPLPGLAGAESQLAVPLALGARLLGVLYVESVKAERFHYDDEDALMAMAGQLALAMQVAQLSADADEEETSTVAQRTPARGQALAIRHFAANDSVFVDNDYLIKGVAGAIFWKLLREYIDQGRTDFSNRELRLDPRLGLPDIVDNLEARLILLQRRLQERCPFLALEKTGRGRFRLRVDRLLTLSES